MSYFSFDVEISYEEYCNWIREVAEGAIPTITDYNTVIVVARKLLLEITCFLKEQKPDYALFYGFKLIELFNKKKVGKSFLNNNKEACNILNAALDLMENQVQPRLRSYYESRVKLLREREPERKHIIEQQMEFEAVSRNESPSVSYESQSDIKRRQLHLLDIQSQHVLLSKLNKVRSKEIVPTCNYDNNTLNNSLINEKTYQTINEIQCTKPSYNYSQSLLQQPLADNRFLVKAKEECNIDHSYSNLSNEYMTQQQSTLSSNTLFVNDMPHNHDVNNVILEKTELSMTTSEMSKLYRSWKFNKVGVELLFPRRGIVNLGNTCYMNSVLQMLNVTPLGDYFSKYEWYNNENRRDDLGEELANSFGIIIRELRRSNCNYAVSPSSFKKVLGKLYDQFNNSSQQDANEFLRSLLDGLHNYLNSHRNNNPILTEIDNTKGTDDYISKLYWDQYSCKNASVIVEECAFQERSCITCLDCGFASRSFTPTLGIELPIPTSKSISIEECLWAYCQKETLDTTSLYECPRCKKKVQSTKQLSLYTLPNILFITLKRFQCYGDFSNANKNNDTIYFQPHLDMSPYVFSSEKFTMYELKSIVNHRGNMHGGHYTADCLGCDHNWFHCSDEDVHEGDKPEKTLAYILCYVRSKNAKY